MKKALVLGAGGFIAHHIAKRLKREGFWVRGADLKLPRFSESPCDDFMVGDLRDQLFVKEVLDQKFDEVYQLAADMGGAGYIFTGENDADVMTNSALINLNILESVHLKQILKESFTLQVPVSILNIINLIQIIQSVAKILPIPQLQTQSMDGRSYLVRECMPHMLEIKEWKLEWQDIIIFMGLRVLGMMVKKKPLQHYVER